METFSLEDDECPELFITQSGSNNVTGEEFGSISGDILGDGTDVSSPCVSIMQSQYSDISDDDDLVFPLSQKKMYFRRQEQFHSKVSTLLSTLRIIVFINK